jgi:hypothetical protein
MAIKTDDLDGILAGKTTDDLDAILLAFSSPVNDLAVLMRGGEAVLDDLDAILAGKTTDDLDAILAGKTTEDLDIIFNVLEPGGQGKRLTLLDDLNLRDTSIYSSPRDISILPHVYGDLSLSEVLCTALDADGTIFHISDRQIMSINKIYADGEPVTAGVRSFTSYKDETGSPIACVIFDNPQYDKKISVSCKGIIDTDSGALIENPADFINNLLLNVQGYDPGVIDKGSLSRFYSDCLQEEIKIVAVLDQRIKLREVLDELAFNIQARWIISDGRSVMRLKWL